MSAVATASPLVGAPPPPARRPRVLFIGAALGAAASALVILTMLAVYLQVRSDNLAAGLTALPDGTVLPLTPGNMSLVTLLMSGITVAWAVYSLRNGDRAHSYFAVLLTLVFGASVIVETAYLYQQLALPTTGTPIATLLYATTGAHLLMLVVGLVFVAVMGFQALGGQLSGRDAEGMSAAALYWYVVIGVYTAVWYGIYITK
jgi:heme/copper-type cytochrome/quinol oxidase subunit 3